MSITTRSATRLCNRLPMLWGKAYSPASRLPFFAHQRVPSLQNRYPISKRTFTTSTILRDNNQQSSKKEPENEKPSKQPDEEVIDDEAKAIGERMHELMQAKQQWEEEAIHNAVRRRTLRWLDVEMDFVQARAQMLFAVRNMAASAEEVKKLDVQNGDREHAMGVFRRGREVIRQFAEASDRLLPALWTSWRVSVLAPSTQVTREHKLERTALLCVLAVVYALFRPVGTLAIAFLPK